MKTSVSTLSQSILGVDFITPEEVMKARPSIVYTNEQIATLVGSLPSEDVLKWCKDNGYAVMPAPPQACSMLDVREIKPTHFYSKTGGWYNDKTFAREDKTSFGWLAIKKTPVSNSNSKNWNEQNELLYEFERVPNAGEATWFITTYFEVRGVRLLEKVHVRTSSLNFKVNRVAIGGFSSEGLGVNVCWGDQPCDCLGLSAVRMQL